MSINDAFKRLREIRVDHANTKDSVGNDRNITRCDFYTGPQHCLNNHEEVIDFNDKIRIDYRRCKAYQLAQYINQDRKHKFAQFVEMGGLI